MKSQWCDNVFKVTFNERRSYDLVFYIEHIYSITHVQDFSHGTEVTIKFFASKVTKEYGDCNDNKPELPHLKAGNRKLMLIGGNENE